MHWTDRIGRLGKWTAVAAAMSLALAACAGPSEIDIADVDDGALADCVRAGDMDPDELPVDLEDLSPKQRKVLGSCLAEQGSSLSALMEHRRGYQRDADAHLRLELACMKDAGWDMPAPVRKDDGILVVDDYDQYGPGEGAEFLADHEECSAKAREQVGGAADHDHDDHEH